MTSATDSTPTSPPLLSAQAVISQLQSARSSLTSKASAEGLSKADERELLKSAQKLKALWDWTKIEQAILTANPKQLTAVEAFESGKYSTVCMLGANRSGKSYCCGRMCFAKHLRDVAKQGEVYWCIAPTSEKSIAGQQKELWQSLPYELMAGQKYDEKNGFGQTRPTLIVDPNGRRIVVRFKSAAQFADDPRSFEQEQVSGIWIDESIEEHVYETLIPRVLDKNGFILVSTIPDIPWMHDRFENASEDTGIAFIKLGMADNEKNLADGAIARALANLSKEEAEMRVFGHFRFVGGLVYREFIKDYKPVGHLIKPFDIPKEWPKWRMLDVGMDHPTACLWATISPNETVYVYREYYSRHTSIGTDCDRIISMSGREVYAGPVIIDPAACSVTKANMKSVAQQYADGGLKCIGGPRVQHAKNGPLKGEEALVMMIKKRLETNSMYVFDTCISLIREFKRWSFKRDSANQPMGNSAYEDRNNDGLDALKLWIGTNPTSKPFRIQVGTTYD
jgi:hypothetical protein